MIIIIKLLLFRSLYKVGKGLDNNLHNPKLMIFTKISKGYNDEYNKIIKDIKAKVVYYY